MAFEVCASAQRVQRRQRSARRRQLDELWFRVAQLQRELAFLARQQARPAELLLFCGVIAVRSAPSVRVRRGVQHEKLEQLRAVVDAIHTRFGAQS